MSSDFQNTSPASRKSSNLPKFYVSSSSPRKKHCFNSYINHEKHKLSDPMEFHSSYTKLRRRNRWSRGFRLSSGRLCVIRLRLRLLTAFELLYQYLRRIKKRFTRRKRNEDSMSGSRRPDCRLRACRRSNSFYAEAIAECLEFIRKTSSSVDDASKMVGGGKAEEDGSSCGR